MNMLNMKNMKNIKKISTKKYQKINYGSCIYPKLPGENGPSSKIIHVLILLAMTIKFPYFE